MTEALITLVTVVALLLGSPGPAPLALAAVGASFGVKHGVPFLLGILSGLTVAITATTLGLSALFAVDSSAKTIVQIVGGLYILYVAIKIATAPMITDGDNHSKAPSFIDGFILNLLNPKAYAAFFAIFSQFLLPIENHTLAFGITALVCMLVATLVDGIWLMLGGVIKPIFKKPLQARLLRVSFAVLMLLAVAWTFYQAG
ncbi:MAG: threonine/homoserine/homoserine lactone efflux protein [Cryomorphaceae bacterium]|jgi:threonine/homoserine/homoserine lactone efflux protein